MTHFAYITHILYCTLYKLQTTCLCVKYFVKNLHRAETIYTGGARGARDKYQVCIDDTNMRYIPQTHSQYGKDNRQLVSTMFFFKKNNFLV